jgi:RNA polymerase sigma factor (sigma-70 family)
MSRPRKPRVTTLSDAEVMARAAEHLGLCGWVARRYLGRGLELEDLVQEGWFGLVRAVELFDESRGLDFSTYAKHWIRDAITRALLDHGHVIRRPRAPKRRPGCVFAHRQTREVLSIDASPVPGSTGAEILEARPDRIDPMELAEVRAAIDALPERERETLKARYDDGLTHREIGARLGFSRQQAHALEKRALARLRELVA